MENKEEKSPQVPKYLDLLEALHKLGFKISFFKDKSELEEKYVLVISRPHS